MREFSVVYPTVDVVILKGDRILLGRKSHQIKYRFVGGFADPACDNSYEDAAIREAKEETGLQVHHVSYIGSCRIDDPRYRNSRDCIITHLFFADQWEGDPVASDDIAELKWFDINSLSEEDLVPEHSILWSMFREWER